MNKNILPIYGSIEEQDFRKPWADKSQVPIRCGAYLLPFSITTDTAISNISFFFRYLDGSKEMIILNAPSYFKQSQINEKYVVYLSNEKPFQNMKKGLQYAEIRLKISGEWVSYFSEVFCYAESVSDCLKLTWWDIEPFEGIPYGTGFRNYIYIPSSLSRPEYTYEEDAQTRDGVVYLSKIVAKKTYRVNMLITESQMDALQLARLADFKVLYDGNKRYNISDLLITPSWTDQTNIANVEIAFTTTESIIKKTAKSITMETIAADFNIDYNNDYLS